MKIKKGFTLIELLAVIIILGFLVLISVPKLRNIISDSKIKARLEDGELFLRALNNEIYARKVKDNNFNPEFCYVEDSIVTCDEKVIDIDKAKNDINGYVYFDNDEMKYYDLVIVDTKYSNIEYTDKRCFEYSPFGGNNISLISYYDYIDNDSNNEACPKEVNIPPMIDNYNVVNLGYFFATDKNLKSVIIPYGVTTISERALDSNNIEFIIIPNSVTFIGNCALCYNELKSVTIPNNVTSIEQSAFQNNQLTSVVISNKVKILGTSAFALNYLTHIKIPDSVTSIGDNAFMCNRLESVEIGENNSMISTIGEDAFEKMTCYDSRTNSIKSIKIHTLENNSLLVNTGLFDYNVEIEWDQLNQ